MTALQLRTDVRLRRVVLLVQNIAWADTYHGREAGLVGETVDAIELGTEWNVAYVDDRDGEASELAEAIEQARRAVGQDAPVVHKYVRELMAHAQARLLHGQVRGVRGAVAA